METQTQNKNFNIYSSETVEIQRSKVNTSSNGTFTYCTKAFNAKNNKDTKNTKCLMELPKLMCYGGIRKRESETGIVDHSIMIKLEGSNPEHLQYIKGFYQCHEDSVDSIFGEKVKVGFKKSTTREQIAGYTKCLIYCGEDETVVDDSVTLEEDSSSNDKPMEEKSYTMFFKLFYIPAKNFGTKFYKYYRDENNKLCSEVIPWDKLMGKNLTIQPLISLRHLHIGDNKVNLMKSLFQCVVYKIEDREDNALQNQTVEKLYENNPELFDTKSLADQVKSIEASGPKTTKKSEDPIDADPLAD